MSVRRTLIAGNWKMNLAPEAGAALAQALVAGLADRETAADLVLAPTALALPAVVSALGGAPLGRARFRNRSRGHHAVVGGDGPECLAHLSG